MLQVDNGSAKQVLRLNTRDRCHQASSDRRQPVHVRKKPGVVDMSVLREDLVESGEVLHIDEWSVAVKRLMDLLPISQMRGTDTCQGKQREEQPHD